jgi:hypothetical protein
MKTVAKCAAVASVVLLTAASSAWSQTYTTNPGPQGTYGGGQAPYYTGNQGTQTYGTSPGTPGTYSGNQGSSYTGTPGTQGYQGPYNPNQGSWNPGTQGSSTPPSGQTYGYGASNKVTTYQQAQQELGRYGFSNIQDLRAMQGWSADAMKNGQRVHVILGDNGLVATTPGR